MTNKVALQILDSIQYATIATSDIDGNPWNTPVFCVADQDNNIYWSSHPGSEHSKNITASHKAFIVIYNSKATEGEGVGLYVQASASELKSNDEIEFALDLLGARRGKPFLHIEKFLPGGQQRIYKATPIKAWLNDAHQDTDGDFIKDYRITVDI